MRGIKYSTALAIANCQYLNIRPTLSLLLTFDHLPPLTYSFTTLSLSPSLILHVLTLLIYPPNSDWPRKVQVLSHLCQANCTASMIDELYDEPFWDDLLHPHALHLFPSSSAGGGLLSVILKNMVLCQAGPLSARWQARLLSTPNLLVPDHLNTPASILFIFVVLLSFLFFL